MMHRGPVILTALLTLLLTAGAALAGAPYRNRPAADGLSGIVLSPGTAFNRGVSPLFDPSRTQWSHSLSYGMASGSTGSMGQGLFMNTMDMRLGMKTDLKLHLGVLNTTFNSFNPADTGSDFVGGAEFQWQPAENVQLQIGLFRGMTPERQTFSPWSQGPLGGSVFNR